MKHEPRFENLVADAKIRIREISAEDSLQRQAQGALLIDVREAEEFAKEHAENAQHLSKGIIEVKIEKQVPDTATEMILYCGGGNRSARGRQFAEDGLSQCLFADRWVQGLEGSGPSHQVVSRRDGCLVFNRKLLTGSQSCPSLHPKRRHPNLSPN